MWVLMGTACTNWWTDPTCVLCPPSLPPFLPPFQPPQPPLTLLSEGVEVSHVLQTHCCPWGLLFFPPLHPQTSSVGIWGSDYLLLILLSPWLVQSIQPLWKFVCLSAMGGYEPLWQGCSWRLGGPQRLSSIRDPSSIRESSSPPIIFCFIKGIYVLRSI